MAITRLKDLQFDAVFCINLARRPDRKRQAEQQFQYLGLEPTWYDAIDMAKWNIECKDKMRPGMIGCYLSHLAILQHCIINKYNRILITEDDLLAITGGNSLLTKALPDLPEDWQFAYLGYTVFEGQLQNNKRINNHWIIPAGCWGTQAYIVNGLDAIKKLYELLSKPQWQIDIDLSHDFLPKSGLKYYGIMPPVIRQQKGRSDVQ